MEIVSTHVIQNLGVNMPEAKVTINPDLKKERQKCTFDVEELARYWIGDQNKLEEKRARGKFFELVFIFICVSIGIFCAKDFVNTIEKRIRNFMRLMLQ